mmetsp:Transcript_12716/g.39007  ORF Transcript_12716/g.39007 Transcript_12716/m.39007 type:complete len:448 (-) Transcript_12716:1661-3004(-)|eukprot:CAMPEP_0198736704 /NCGR_PEP_ID=MMETSP1475-20131203/67492_1 /TAXON_ID= ORGANISM="Unidentified sp., Strain CCMP1999" /NCGR_SAMPLE_ID=MMETSP1475 /ASSEMBLY_ACC=CAM_ASM_001111 /LENGTH=447 /DNA_ID=CAMNT_0044500553 /DNA_START=48 /DNA_END=1391 /DNA_ORIENTATION=-
MADLFLNGLDERCHEWLLFSDQRDFVPNLAAAERTLVIEKRESYPGSSAFSVEMTLMAEIDTPNYVLGRLSANFPVTRVLKFGDALEQRFCLHLRDYQPELTGSSLYDNQKLLLWRFDLTMCQNWRDYLHLVIVKLDNPNKLLVSGTLSGQNPRISKERPVALQSAIRQFGVEGSSLWDLFCQVTSSCTGETSRQAMMFSHCTGQKLPLLRRDSTFCMRAYTSGPRVEHLRNQLIRKSVENVSVYFRLSMSDIEGEDDDLSASNGDDFGSVLMIKNDVENPQRAFVKGESLIENVSQNSGEIDEGLTTATLAGDPERYEVKPQCAYCGSLFERRYDRDRHVRTVHLRERRFVCNTCGKKFSQSAHLKSHNETVHEQKRDSFCEKCQQSFSTKYKLQRHIRSVHFRERSFHCEFCSSSYFQRSDLTRHLDHCHKSSKGSMSATNEVNA